MPKRMLGRKRNKLAREIAKTVIREKRARARKAAMRQRYNPFEEARIKEAPHGKW